MKGLEGAGGATTAAPIVRLLGAEAGSTSADAAQGGADELQRARAFAEPLLMGQRLDTGEPAWAHAQGTEAALAAIGASPSMRAAAYLVYAGDFLQRPEEVVAKAFGSHQASLVSHTRRLVQIQRAAREASVGVAQRAGQTERVRKMLLAFSRDLRVVLLRLASRLQTLRWHARSRTPCPPAIADEAMHVFAPLANRLGIGQIKWELEDLALRFLQPEIYHSLARSLDETRAERERVVQAVRDRVAQALQQAGIAADVHGRPKHLHSIWKKMQGKGLPLERVFDLRALRVIVDDVPACYAALARVHELLEPVDGEFDDYIARPKPNGYQSLHTVVLWDDGRPVEVQVRTRAMHEHAEHGVAAHWMYKEAGARGYAGVRAEGSFESRVAEARKAVMRQLLAWERDFSDRHAEGGGPAAAQVGSHAGPAAGDERIYVFTPDATLVDLPPGGTPVDFAYSLHTELGHRCRGARVDGVMVPLNTALSHGQTVEVIAAKEGGPSLDWLNPELGYLKSPRAKAKARAWFNAQALGQTVARGRELVERLLQREGRTAMRLELLAERLGFKTADALFEVVGKDEYSLRQIEAVLRPVPAAPAAADAVALKRPRDDVAQGRGGVLVVGLDSLLTTLARCCRPAPPDPIGGFVTRGKGVAVHRRDCSNFRHLAGRHADRVIEVAWGQAGPDAAFPIDVVVEAVDRQGLLRDVSEVFVRERVNVTGVRSESVKDAAGATAWMTFTVEVPDIGRLRQVLAQVARVGGVRQARRR